MKNIFIIAFAVLVAGCTNMGLMTGTAGDPSPNTFKCYTGEFHGTYTASNVAGGIIVLPEGINPSDLTPEQIKSYAEILGC